jgi:exodeoxyribonuclease-3
VDLKELAMSITRPCGLPAASVSPEDVPVVDRSAPSPLRRSKLAGFSRFHFGMRVVTLNVNGIRSADRCGFARWITRIEPWDVICLQELRAAEGDVPRALKAPRKCSAAFNPALRKGYAGVGMYAKGRPGHRQRLRRQGVRRRRPLPAGGFRGPVGHQPVPAVRVQRAAPASVQVSIPGGVSCRTLRSCGKSKREIILCGDWNIAHQPIDLKNWRSNQKNSGFLPEERAWLTHVFDELGFVDVFRKVDPRPEQYTWWSNRGEAWAKNVGWRIDYQIATPGVAATARSASIYRNRRFSDHAPLIIDYDYELR